MLLNIWEQWSEANYSTAYVPCICISSMSWWSDSWCYENFVQFKTLSRVRDIRDQLAGLCERVEIVPEANANTSDITPIQKALVAGFFHCSVSTLFIYFAVRNLLHLVYQAQLQKSGDSYRTTKSHQTVYIHPSSSLFHSQPPIRTLIYYELVMTSKSYLRNVMEVKPQWLMEAGPHYFK